MLVVQYNQPNERDGNIQKEVMGLSNKFLEGSGHSNILMLFRTFFIYSVVFSVTRQDDFC